MSYLILILFSLILVGVFLLVAAGGLGNQELEDDWQQQDLADLNQVNLPLALFGYRRSTVDKLLEQIQQTRKDEHE